MNLPRAALPAAAWLILAAAFVLSGCSNASAPGDSAGEHWIAVFENEAWYRERTEPEQLFTGVLVRRHPPEGPGTRLGLPFALRSAAAELPIYSARVEPVLEGFLGRTITARGRLVEASGAGSSGSELWIGRFSISPEPAR